MDQLMTGAREPVRQDVQVCHGDTFDAVLLFNTGDAPANYQVDWAVLGLPTPPRGSPRD